MLEDEDITLTRAEEIVDIVGKYWEILDINVEKVFGLDKEQSKSSTGLGDLSKGGL